MSVPEVGRRKIPAANGGLLQNGDCVCRCFAEAKLTAFAGDQGGIVCSGAHSSSIKNVMQNIIPHGNKCSQVIDFEGIYLKRQKYDVTKANKLKILALPPCTMWQHWTGVRMGGRLV